MNIELQLLGSALRSIAEEMGAVLVRSAFSANIKERRDCSTALFDERGRMIAQAEHIPVHLGAMPDAVAAVMRHDPSPEDVFVLNDPSGWYTSRLLSPVGNFNPVSKTAENVKSGSCSIATGFLPPTSNVLRAGDEYLNPTVFNKIDMSPRPLSVPRSIARTDMSMPGPIQ